MGHGDRGRRDCAGIRPVDPTPTGPEAGALNWGIRPMQPRPGVVRPSRLRVTRPTLGRHLEFVRSEMSIPPGHPLCLVAHEGVVACLLWWAAARQCRCPNCRERSSLAASSRHGGCLRCGFSN
jgi:hypothetical protein